MIEKAMSGHFAYFRLVLDLVDGKLRPNAEKERMFEAHFVLDATERGRNTSMSNAA